MKIETMTISEMKEQVAKINAKLNYLKIYHVNGDDNPWGSGSVADIKRTLRYRKKCLQESIKLKSK